MADFTPIPTRWVGDFAIAGNALNESISAPLATYETPLWPSVARGAKVSRLSPGGIVCTVIDARMSRSILLETPGAAAALAALERSRAEFGLWQQLVSTGSRFCQLIQVNSQIVGNLLYLRLEFSTGDASGHNMATKGAEAIMNHIVNNWDQVAYGSISGNYCIDKKASAVNGILGRGKYVVAEITVPGEVCARQLRTTAEKICQLNLRKNHIGSNLAGSIRSANAHFANMLLAFYLATGQDAANIIEGSQGIVHTEQRGSDLYFSCTLPNLIVGTVGNGKGLPQIEENLQRIGCRAARASGENSRRLAAIGAAVVLAGELSLLAAQTNPGELMRSHLALERNGH